MYYNYIIWYRVWCTKATLSFIEYTVDLKKMLSHVFNIAVNNLPMQLSVVYGAIILRKSWIAFVFFTKVWYHRLTKILVCFQYQESYSYIGNRRGQNILIYSLMISTIPEHLPFFLRFLIQLMISVSFTSILSASELKFGTLNSSRESSTPSCEHTICWFCLFDLILYAPSTIFQFNRDESSWVEPVLS